MSGLMNVLDTVEMTAVSESLKKIQTFQSVVQKTLKKDQDYGVIQGTQKPTLLKPGAEKILMLLGLTSEYVIDGEVEDYERGIFAYRVRCILYSNGIKITEGLGSCNSKEDKYRWRWVNEEDIPAGVDPTTLKSKTNNYGKVKYRIENDDICSQANTILKMAKKRAQIDATLTVGSLSEIFTQDVEDMAEFAQKETMDNMKADEVTNIKITFGKHKGKTLGQVMKEAPDYIEWLEKNGNDPAMRKACSLILNNQHKVQKPVPQQNEQVQQPEDIDYSGTPFGEGLANQVED
jgi:hypothetical protein